MKTIRLFIFAPTLSLFLILISTIDIFAQQREDLPLYHVEQNKKQQTLNFLTQNLRKFEGMHLNHDSLQQKMTQDSIKRYNLLQKPKSLQTGNRKSYRE
jgi:hypothetical protein